MGGPCFYLYDHDGVKREVNVDNRDFSTFDERPYMPIHSACLNMARRIIKHSSHKYLNSVRGLFLALRWRHAVSNMFGAARAEANYMLGPTCWYLPANISGKATFLGDPVEIDDITDAILSNLTPCRRQTGEIKADSFRIQLAALPKDIYRIILSHLRSYRDLPREAVYALPQHFWKNELILVGTGLLPWLWDIDPEKVNLKANEHCPGGEDFEWNWELLVRQLSSKVDGGIRPDVPEDREKSPSFKYDEDLWSFTGYGTILVHVPRGLDSRRRIWQLLEEMFVGDQLPVAGERFQSGTPLVPKQNCVQLPWTKEGFLREFAIWLPMINTDGAFVRRIVGEVYRKPNKSPLQYWQTAELRSNDSGGCDEPVEPASISEIFEVIRKLGYPV